MFRERQIRGRKTGPRFWRDWRRGRVPLFWPTLAVSGNTESRMLLNRAYGRRRRRCSLTLMLLIDARHPRLSRSTRQGGFAVKLLRRARAGEVSLARPQVEPLQGGLV